MVDSNYFIGGYAIHGYPEVPSLRGQPRLHPRADPERAAIFAWIKLGDPIFVYR